MLSLFAGFFHTTVEAVDTRGLSIYAVPDDPLALSYNCLSAIASLRLGDVEGFARARTYAQKLVSSLVQDDAGLSGWTYVQRLTSKASKCGQAGSIDAFGDGTCNPTNTPYMLQTGYAIGCLSQMSVVTQNDDYLRLAIRVVGDSWELGAAPVGCTECFYYWYSYHQNDRNRYVRNTNLAMGFGLAWLYVATQEPAYRQRLNAIVRSEHYELAKANYGYFGVADPRYVRDPLHESERIENHVVHQVHALKSISLILKDPSAMGIAQELLDSYLGCSNRRCLRGDCASWAAPIACKATATIIPCVLADVLPKYRARCDEVLRAFPGLNAFQTFLIHGAHDRSDLDPRSR